jgi:hypothetical protein
MLSAQGFSALLRGRRLALTVQELRPSTVESYTRDVPLGMATLQAVERYATRWHVDEVPLWRGKRGTLTRSGVLQVVRRHASPGDNLRVGRPGVERGLPPISGG